MCKKQSNGTKDMRVEERHKEREREEEGGRGGACGACETRFGRNQPNGSCKVAARGRMSHPSHQRGHGHCQPNDDHSVDHPCSYTRAHQHTHTSTHISDTAVQFSECAMQCIMPDSVRSDMSADRSTVLQCNSSGCSICKIHAVKLLCMSFLLSRFCSERKNRVIRLLADLAFAALSLYQRCDRERESVCARVQVRGKNRCLAVVDTLV